MKKIFALGLCGMLFAPVKINAGPRAETDRTTYDFGVVRSGVPLSCRFAIKNIGDETLRISELAVCCPHCLTVRPSAWEATPGETLFLQVVIPTRGSAGGVVREFTLKTNVPERPKLTFRIMGTIRPWYRLTPSPFFFLRELAPGAPRSWQFTLTLVDLPDCALKSIHSPEPFALQAGLNQKRRSHPLTLRYKGGPLPRGLFRSSVILATDSVPLPRIEIPLVVRVLGDVCGYPPFVVLTRPAAESSGFIPFQKSLLLRRSSQQPFSILGMTSPSPALQVSFSRSPAPHQTVRLTLTAPLPKGKLGDLVVSTDVPGEREIRIPVHIAAIQPPDGQDTTAQKRTPSAALSAEKALAAVASALGKEPDALMAEIGKRGDGDLAVWAASRLCRNSFSAAELRNKLGGIGLVRYARARDMITLRMARDAAFAARCRRIVEQARRALLADGMQ